MWSEPACTAGAARAHRDPAEPFAPVYYRVCLDRVTGHRATPDPRTVNLPAAPVRKEGWLRRALGVRPPAASPPDEPEQVTAADGPRLKRGGVTADGVRAPW